MKQAADSSQAFVGRALHLRNSSRVAPESWAELVEWTSGALNDLVGGVTVFPEGVVNAPSRSADGIAGCLAASLHYWSPTERKRFLVLSCAPQIDVERYSAAALSYLAAGLAAEDESLRTANRILSESGQASPLLLDLESPAARRAADVESLELVLAEASRRAEESGFAALLRAVLKSEWLRQAGSAGLLDWSPGSSRAWKTALVKAEGVLTSTSEPLGLSGLESECRSEREKAVVLLALSFFRIAADVRSVLLCPIPMSTRQMFQVPSAVLTLHFGAAASDLADDLDAIALYADQVARPWLNHDLTSFADRRRHRASEALRQHDFGAEVLDPMTIDVRYMGKALHEGDSVVLAARAREISERWEQSLGIYTEHRLGTLKGLGRASAASLGTLEEELVGFMAIRLQDVADQMLNQPQRSRYPDAIEFATDIEPLPWLDGVFAERTRLVCRELLRNIVSHSVGPIQWKQLGEPDLHVRLNLSVCRNLGAVEVEVLGNGKDFSPDAGRRLAWLCDKSAQPSYLKSLEIDDFFRVFGGSPGRERARRGNGLFLIAQSLTELAAEVTDQPASRHDRAAASQELNGQALLESLAQDGLTGIRARLKVPRSRIA